MAIAVREIEFSPNTLPRQSTIASNNSVVVQKIGIVQFEIRDARNAISLYSETKNKSIKWEKLVFIVKQIFPNHC